MKTQKIKIKKLFFVAAFTAVFAISSLVGNFAGISRNNKAFALAASDHLKIELDCSSITNPAIESLDNIKLFSYAAVGGPHWERADGKAADSDPYAAVFNIDSFFNDCPHDTVCEHNYEIAGLVAQFFSDVDGAGYKRTNRYAARL